MVLLAIAKRRLGWNLSCFNVSSKNISNWKGDRNMVRNLQKPTRKPIVQFRKGTDITLKSRTHYETRHSIENHYVPKNYVTMSKNFIDEFRFGGYLFPLPRNQRLEKRLPFLSGERWYSPDSKDPKSSGGPVRRGGGRVGKLDAANEGGFFHKVNKSKQVKLQKTLKNKPENKKDK